MPKKKITVVDIKEGGTDDINDINDSNETNEKLDTITEQDNNIETKIIPFEQDKPIETPVEDKITRTNELIKCPKCLKMVTNKTLRYSHKKTCSGEEEKQKPVKQRITEKPNQIPDIEEEPQNISPPKLVRTISKIAQQQPTQPTDQMIREHRNQQRNERLQMRSDRMSSMFKNSI
jgi:hypothetical protein